MLDLSDALKHLPSPSKLFSCFDDTIKKLEKAGLSYAPNQALLFEKRFSELKKNLLNKSPNYDKVPPKDILTAASLMEKALRSYEKEEAFQTALQPDLDTFFYSVRPQTLFGSSSSEQSHPRLDLGRRANNHQQPLLLIFELKCGMGSGGGDAKTQLIGYYLHSLKESIDKWWQKSNRPTLLIAIVGSVWIVYGAVYLGKTVTTAKIAWWDLELTSIQHFGYQLYQLKQTLESLEETNQSTMDVFNQQHEQYPCWTEFTFRGVSSTLEYTGRYLDHLVFSATVKGEKVVVKFTRQYSEEAHKAASTYAPELFCCFKVSPLLRYSFSDC